MEWQDQGVLLSVRRHGEGAAIIEIFSENHGRHSGLVRGGGSRKSAALLQPGSQLSVTWRARLEDQLGSFTVELNKSRSAILLANRQKLFIFNALSSMLSCYLPEREPNRDLYLGCQELLDLFEEPAGWQHRYAIFEFEFLEALGYGVDFSECAATGQVHDLTYVSPKSGRAVSTKGAKGWEDRLLVLPDFLSSDQLLEISKAEFEASLTLSGHFFEKWIPSGKQDLPAPRLRLVGKV